MASGEDFNARLRRQDAQAQTHEASLSARRLEERAAIQSALADLDAQTVRDTQQFVRAVAGIPESYVIQRMTSPPKKTFFKTRPAEFQSETDGHLVWDKRHQISEDAVAYRKVVVRLSGEVIFVEQDVNVVHSPTPAADDLPEIHPDSARVHCELADARWEITRTWTRDPQGPGLLPFAYAPRRQRSKDEIEPLRWLASGRSLRHTASPAEQIRATADWYRDCLSMYAREHL